MSTVNRGIITNGLVLCLDASNVKSASSGSAIWNNIGRTNISGSLTNGAIYSSASLGCISFDGLDDYISFSPTTIFNITSKITVEAFINPSVNNQNALIVSKWHTGGNTNNSYCLWAGQDAATNKFSFSIEQSNLTIKPLNSTVTYNANQWYHLVGVADGSFVRLYINGVSSDTPLAYDGTININTSDFRISVLSSLFSTYYFKGKIANVRIYDRGLSETEVLQNYNVTKTRFGL